MCHWWHGRSHRLHGGLHHHGLCHWCHPLIARPGHRRRRKRLTLPKTVGWREWHHRCPLSFWGRAPWRLRAFRFPTLLWCVGAALRTISASPILLALPALIVIPSTGIHLLRFLSAGLVDICPIQNHLPWLLADMTVTRRVLPELFAPKAAPRSVIRHCSCDEAQEDLVL